MEQILNGENISYRKKGKGRIRRDGIDGTAYCDLPLGIQMLEGNIGGKQFSDTGREDSLFHTPFEEKVRIGVDIV